MTARLPWHDLPCVPPAARASTRYVGDHVIRHYQTRTLAELAHDLGIPTPDRLEVTGGIGTLVLTPTAVTFTPATPDLPPSSSLTITPEAIAARREACRTCPQYRPDVDHCQMCGCAGQITHRAPRPWSTCPRGLWPA